MRTCARHRDSIIGALVLFSILVIAGFLYSPWHLHSRISPNTCPFSTFEHSAYSGESAPAVFLPPPVHSYPIIAAPNPARPATIAASLLSVRAPPC